jgi:hypothetical protein
VTGEGLNIRDKSYEESFLCGLRFGIATLPIYARPSWVAVLRKLNH